MDKVLIGRKLIKAAIFLVILLYFVFRTTSPKIIFVPFLICGVASLGKNLGLLLNRTRIAFVFDRLYKAVFFLSWFAFLIFACYIAVRDKNYKVIFFTLPFWVGGLFFVKWKLFGSSKQKTDL